MGARSHPTFRSPSEETDAWMGAEQNLYLCHHPLHNQPHAFHTTKTLAHGLADQVERLVMCASAQSFALHTPARDLWRTKRTALIARVIDPAQ
jgi:hypothetical protein